MTDAWTNSSAPVGLLSSNLLSAEVSLFSMSRDVKIWLLKFKAEAKAIYVIKWLALFE